MQQPHKTFSHCRKQIGQNLREIRLSKSLTIEAFADKTGSSVEGLARLEQGKEMAELSRLFAFAQVLEVPLARFFKQT